jgi:hypothetical protein
MRTVVILPILFIPVQLFKRNRAYLMHIYIVMFVIFFFSTLSVGYFLVEGMPLAFSCVQWRSNGLNNGECPKFCLGCEAGARDRRPNGGGCREGSPHPP